LPLNSNVIYDHQQPVPTNTSTTIPNGKPATVNNSPPVTQEISHIIQEQRQRASSAKSAILTNLGTNLNNKLDNIANLLQSKRNKLRVSSVNNLSNLLAMDESKTNNVANLSNGGNVSQVAVGQNVVNFNVSGETVHIKQHQPSGLSPPSSPLYSNIPNPNYHKIIAAKASGNGLSPSYSSSSISTIVTNSSQSEHEKSYELLKKQQQIYMKKSINSLYSRVEPLVQIVSASVDQEIDTRQNVSELLLLLSF
jgi:hypothetical protein